MRDVLMMFPAGLRVWSRRSVAALAAVVCVAGFAGSATATTSPGPNPPATTTATPAKDADATTHDHPDDASAALTPAQEQALAQALAAAEKLAKSQERAAVLAKAAGLAAAQAAAASQEFEEASQVAASAQVEALVAGVEAARMQRLVDGWARGLAAGEQVSPTQQLVAGMLVGSSDDPWVSVRDAHARSRVAGVVAETNAALDEARDRVAEASQRARDAQDRASVLFADAQQRREDASAALRQARKVLAADIEELTGHKVGPGGWNSVWTGPGYGQGANGLGGCLPWPKGATFSNGLLPVAVLCPVAAAPGHRLRTDAARAFDRLSMVYERVFGSPLCITDSYRSYAAQVDVKKRKPTLAATPGTSNHGWGQAIDACDGINSFGTVQHRWMLANAPLFGWVSPAWAQQSGSKPEPWHWEFSAALASGMADTSRSSTSTGSR